MIWSEIALIAVSAVLLIVVISWIVTAVKRKRKDDDKRVGDVYISQGTRYTKDDRVVDENGNVKVNMNKNDFLMECGKEYEVSKNGKLLPGKYTILSADENTECMNMRIGGLVRKYKHFSSIVLAEGDKISAVSHNVILR